MSKTILTFSRHGACYLVVTVQCPLWSSSVDLAVVLKSPSLVGPLMMHPLNDVRSLQIAAYSGDSKNHSSSRQRLKLVIWSRAVLYPVYIARVRLLGPKQHTSYRSS